MCSSYAMMASRVTPPAEEGGAEVDRVKWAGGVAVLVHGYFGQSWASLRRTDTALMALMMEK